MSEDDSPRARLGGTRTRQLALLAVCLLGLSIAAFAAPQVDPQVGAGSGPGGGVGGGVTVDDLLEYLFDESSDDPEAEDGGLASAACTVDVVGQRVPGQPVVAVVQADGAPVEGATVRFNGEAVGTTDQRGRVNGTVPWEQRLVVAASLPGTADCEAENEVQTQAVGAVARGAAADPVVRDEYEVDGTVHVDVRGDPVPGETVTVVATVDGYAMPDATVTADGRTVGTTDDRGEVAYRVPDDRETVLLRATRGDFAGRHELRVERLAATVEPAGLLALPGDTAVLRASLAGEPATDATARLDGERLGTTDTRGRLRFTLPADPTATVTVDGETQSATAAIWHVYAGTVGAVALVVGTAAVVLGLLVTGGRAAVRGFGWVARLVLRLATRLDALLTRLEASLARWGAWARRRGRWLLATLAGGRDGLVALVGSLVAGVGSLPGRLVGAIRRVQKGLWGWLTRWRRDERVADEASDDRAGAAGGESRRDPPTLRERWRAFARWVAPDSWRTRTPTEVEREAIAAGFPPEPVRDLARAFRDVEYGGASLSESQRRRVREAFERLADARGTPTRADGEGRRDGGATDGEGDG